MNRKAMLRALIVPVYLTLLCGCAKPLRLFIPPPPEEPRFEFIKHFQTKSDFSESSFAKALNQAAGGGLEDAEFAIPGAMALSADGTKLYVADAKLPNVKVLDFKAKTSNLLLKDHLSEAANGVAVADDGTVFFSTGNRKVEYGAIMVVPPGYDKPQKVIAEERLGRPTYLAANSRLQRLYSVDAKNHRVTILDFAGNILSTFRMRDPATELHGPQQICIGPDDKLYVAETYGARVAVFNADGSFVAGFGRRGTAPGDFESLRGIALDSEGRIYVSDVRRGNISIFDRNFQFLLEMGMGTQTRHPLGFMLPSAIVIDPRDRIYISDAGNSRIAIYQFLSAGYLQEHPISDEDKRNVVKAYGELGLEIVEKKPQDETDGK